MSIHLATQSFCFMYFSIISLLYDVKNAPLDTSVITVNGDPSTATKELKWKARTHWKELAKLMIDADMAAFKK